MIFRTKRLLVRRAEPSDEDVDFFYRLWTDPQVMVNVGYPQGLRITRDKIRADITERDETEYNTCLIIELQDTGEIIGECKLRLPDGDGISETDVKLLPRHWRRGYGTEIKQALVDYLFTHTDCRAVTASPNKNNIASRKMQEAVGGKRVDEGIFRFPEHMRDYTVNVPFYRYMVFRSDWEKRLL